MERAAALARAIKVKPGRPEDNARRPVLFVLEYRDDFKGAAYMLDSHVEGWQFAGRLGGKSEPVSTHFGPGADARDLPHFDGLVRVIEDLFVTGKAGYPVERTLLTTGALDFLMHSLHHGKRLTTPELKIAYRPPRDVFVQTA